MKRRKVKPGFPKNLKLRDLPKGQGALNHETINALITKRPIMHTPKLEFINFQKNDDGGVVFAIRDLNHPTKSKVIVPIAVSPEKCTSEDMEKALEAFSSFAQRHLGAVAMEKYKESPQWVQAERDDQRTKLEAQEKRMAELEKKLSQLEGEKVNGVKTKTEDAREIVAEPASEA